MQIYRKRFQPEECVLLKDDEIVYSDSSYICTRWETLKPRNDFDNGASIYDIEHGVKVSKFCKGNDIVYYYVDIIGMEYLEGDDTYICTDYVLDVIVETDLTTYKVLDEDEFDELIEKGVFTSKEITDTYSKLNFMLDCIKAENFDFYMHIFESSGI